GSRRRRRGRMSLSRDFSFAGERRRVTARPLGDHRYEITVDGRSRIVEARRLPDGRLRLRADDEILEAAVAPVGQLPGGARGKGLHVRVASPAATFVLPVWSGAGSQAHGPGADGTITAPMTGTVLSVAVRPGQAVAADETVAVVSAMKMEHRLRAALAGTVLEVLVLAGQTVD